MRYSPAVIKKTKKLRSKGKTYAEITKVLNIHVPKSTLSCWCEKVKLPVWYEKKIKDLNLKNFRRCQQLSLVSNRIKREKIISDIEEANGCLKSYLNDKNILRMILSVLYLGEGSKWKSHSGLMLGSSEPVIILLYLKLLKVCYEIQPKQLKCRISYRADQNIKILEGYWSKVTGISLKNFYKTKPDPRTIGKKTKKLDYKGVCVIMGGSSTIQLELEMIPKIILRACGEAVSRDHGMIKFGVQLPAGPQ